MTAPSARSFGSLLSKVKWLVDARFNDLLATAGIDVTPEQWSIMIVLYTTPGISQTDLARRAFKNKSNVGRILDVLQRRGWVERSSHSADRRALRVTLTPRGRTVTQAVFPVASSVNDQAVAALSETDATLLLDLLAKVKNGLESGT